MSLDSKAALAAVERELADLERRRGEIDRAVARLRRIALWLRQRAAQPKGPAARPARGSAPLTRPSLTDGCRAALRVGDPTGVTPRDVKRLLAMSGVEWGRYSNAMAAIHTVLKRLVRQGEATTSLGPDGRRRFAAIRTTSVALTRQEASDQGLIQAILEADSPDAVTTLLTKRRSSRPRS
jgi:hypothetical protein